MTVFRKTMPNGNESPCYYYRFMIDGKRYTGSTGCDTLKAAQKFEREVIRGLRTETSAKALVEKRRQQLSGGRKIELAEAFAEFAARPRRHQTCQKSMCDKNSQWDDFRAFLRDRYPGAKDLSDVTRSMAEAYLQYLRTEGKYEKSVTFRRGGGRKAITYSPNSSRKLSPRTCNAYHATLAEVFKVLVHDAGLLENPFRHVPKLKQDTESREAFTPDELRRIGQNADDFTYPIFAIGMNTAFREGDICTLRWEEVDLEQGWITRRIRKTRKAVRIPILPPLRAYLLQLRAQSGDGRYVLPEHARMYEANPTGITYRVRKFLEDLEIRTTRKVDGRTRKISVKDVHSLRHTFCYLAAIYGIPFPIVKSVAGHVDPKVTQMYMDHANDEMKREKLASMPNFLGLPEPGGTADSTESKRAKARALITHAGEAQLDRILALLGG